MQKRYEASWASLRRHSTPEWLRRDKFGIYTHWGVYSVPACGPNGSWYAHNMYRKGNSQYDFHEKTYGPSSKFGYKDLIPLFRAENFNADEWAEIFKSSGARFAGPVAEHHDGFPMYNSDYTKWCAAKMGPKRDIIGELSKAIRKQGLTFGVSSHRVEHWWFFGEGRKIKSDVTDERYRGLYGPAYPLGLDLLEPRLHGLDQVLIIRIVDHRMRVRLGLLQPTGLRVAPCGAPKQPERAKSAAAASTGRAAAAASPKPGI